MSAHNDDVNNAIKLSKSILELKAIVDKASNNFDLLTKILKSLSENNLIDDPTKYGDYRYKTFLGSVLNYFKPYALNKDTSAYFVAAAAQFNAFSFLIKQAIDTATGELASNPNFETAKQSLLNLTNANRPDERGNLVVYYLEQFKDVFNFVNTWNTLDPNVKQLIRDHCQTKLNINPNTVDDVFTHPFKHIVSLQLHLGAMATIIGKYPNDQALAPIAIRFRETSELLGAKILAFNNAVNTATTPAQRPR